MAVTLATLTANYFAFLPSENAERDGALSDTPVDFVDGSAEIAELSGQYSLSSLTDDNITVSVKIESSAGTVYAAADAGGTAVEIVNLSNTPGSNGITLTPFEFAYVRPGVTKANWDAARLVAIQTYSNNMGGDGGYWQHNFVDTGIVLTLKSSQTTVIGTTESLTLTCNPATVSKIFTTQLDFTGATSGDTLLAFIGAAEFNAVIDVPVGWTLVGDVYNSSSPSTARSLSACYKKEATGSETTVTFGCNVACVGVAEIVSSGIYADVIQGTERLSPSFGGVGGVYQESTGTIPDKSRFYAFATLRESNSADPLPDFDIPAQETIVGEVTGGTLVSAASYRVIDYFGTAKIWQIAGTLTNTDADNHSCGDATDALIKGGSGFNRRTSTWDGTTTTLEANSIAAYRNRQPAGTTSAAVVFCDNGTGFNNTEEWNGASWANVNAVPVAGSASCFAGGTQTAALLLPHTTTLKYAYTYNGTSFTVKTAASNNHYSGCFAGSPSEALLAGTTNSVSTYIGTEEWNGTSWSAGDTMPAAGFGYLGGRLLGGVGDAVHTGALVSSSYVGVDHDYDGVAWATSRSNFYIYANGTGSGSTASGNGLATGGDGLSFSTVGTSVRVLDAAPGSTIDSGATAYQIVPSVSTNGSMVSVVVPIDAPVIVQPPAATLTLTGYRPATLFAPFLDHTRVREPSFERMDIISDAPIFDNTVDGTNIVAGETESLTLTVNPATIRKGRTAFGVTESLTLTCNPAIVQQIPQTNRFVVGDTESLTLTGNPATIVTDRVVTGVTESLTLTGNRPTIPVVGETESLTLTGNPATVSKARLVAGATESLTLTGNPATLTKDRNLVLPTESLTLTGTPATVRTSRFVIGNTESLIFSGNRPTLPVVGPTEFLSLTANPAVVDQDRLVQGTTAALALTVNPAIVDQDRVIAGDTESLTLTTNAAAIGQGQTARGDTAEMLLTTAPAVIKRGRTVRPNTEKFVLNGKKAFVDQGRNVRGNTAGLVITAFASVFKQRRVRLTTEFLVLTANNTAAIGRGRTVRCGTHTLLLGSEPAFVGRGKTVRPATANNLLTGNIANVGQLIRGEIFGETAALRLTANAAYVQRMTIDDPLLNYKRVGVVVLGVDVGANLLPTHRDGVTVISTSGAEKYSEKTDVFVRRK